jgi:outer membrane usher protein
MGLRWTRRAVVSVIVAALSASGATGIDATESPSAAAVIAKPDQRTFATVVVNGEERGEQIVVLKADDVYASIADLRADGLVIPPRLERGDADRYLNVKNLAPEIVAVFDLDGPTLRLDARGAESLTRRSNISIRHGEDLSQQALSGKSGYFNYSLSGGSAGLSGAQELTLSDSSKTLFSAGTFDAYGFHRSLTNLTWYSPVKLRQTVIGDVVADSGTLGSAVTMTGVSVARASEAESNDHTFTSSTLQGTVLSPSTADVYINGQLIQTLNVAPGVVDFGYLPYASGVTDATIVLRDSFGHTQTLSTRYYGAVSVLAKGATDYSFSAGEAATGGVLSQSSAGLAALGRYRIGVTQSTTAGAHAEVAGGFENLGATVDHAGRLGIWDVGVAESRNHGASGLAGIVAYAFGTKNIWLNAAINAATPAYTTFAQRAFSDRTTSDERISLGIRPFRGPYTSTLSYSASRSLLGESTRQFSWQHSIPLPGRISLLLTTGVSATRNGSRPDFAVYLSRSTAQGSSVPTVNTSLQSDGSALQPALELQRSAPPRGGTGYDVMGYPSGPMLSSGRYAVRSSIGNVDMDYDVARAGSLSGNVALSGAIAFAGPYALFSQPISDSFAIVRVLGGERVKVLIDNQEAGTTDGKGFIVLPNLQSYHAQRIGIVRDDGPVNLDISSAEQSIDVASRHGTVAQFSASVVTAIMGSVTVSERGRSVIPAFGQLLLMSGEKSVTSELDRAGRFYFEDVTAGSHAAVVRYAGGDCRFTLRVPRTTGIEQRIGDFTCARS